MFEGREHVNSMPGKDLSNRDIVRRLSMSEVGKLNKDDLQRALKSMITSEPEPNQPTRFGPHGTTESPDACTNSHQRSQR